MKKIFLIAIGMFFLVGFTDAIGQAPKVPKGAVNGLFTINKNGDQVYFSKGNLQYIGSAKTPYWKFADHQWEIINTESGCENSPKIDRDLFAWGASGQPHVEENYQPWSGSTIDAYLCEYGIDAYGDDYYDLFDKDGSADWGYNPISNGGNVKKQWRTLHASEMEYLLLYRKTPSEIRFAKAQVNGVNGLVLVPDDWRRITNTLEKPNDSWAAFSTNIISAEEWSDLEKKGAVFLPAAGEAHCGALCLNPKPEQIKLFITGRGTEGEYWTSKRCHDRSNLSRAYSFSITQKNVVNYVYKERYMRLAVRLVQDAHKQQNHH